MKLDTEKLDRSSAMAFAATFATLAVVGLLTIIVLGFILEPIVTGCLFGVFMVFCAFWVYFYKFGRME